MTASETHDPVPADASRRSFLAWGSGVLSALIAAVVAWPLVGSLLRPQYRRPAKHYVKVPGLDSVPVGRPVRLSFSDVHEDAYLRQVQVHNVWVLRRSAEDVVVFSPICTHLGCDYTWHPESQKFVCPCHGSVFSITGEVLAGPAPRPLDRLPFKIDGGELLVEWERFEAGASRSIPV